MNSRLRDFAQRFNDLVRQYAEPATADDSIRRDVVVFSGGGPRGAVQVGMLRGLLEHGVRPVASIGCSVGALNAAWHAAMPTVDGVDGLESLWLSLRGEDVFPTTRRAVVAGIFQRDHLVSADGVRGLVARLPITEFEQTALPLRIVSTRLDNGELVIHGAGELLLPLLASCAIPGVLPPVEIGGVRHIDGGVANVAPVRLAREFAPTRVFLLDATGPGYVGTHRTALDVLRAGFAHSTRSKMLQARTEPGVVTVSVPDDTFLHGDQPFTRTAELIEAGYVAAKAALDAARSAADRDRR
jgi:NTE family protein